MKYHYVCRLCGWTSPDFEHEEQDEVQECLEFMGYCKNHLESEHPEIYKNPNREPIMDYFPKIGITENASDDQLPISSCAPVRLVNGKKWY